MYPNLEAELKRRGVKRIDLAQHLNMALSTLADKMQGKSTFSVQNAVDIKKFLKLKMPLEELFEEVLYVPK